MGVGFIEIPKGGDMPAAATEVLEKSAVLRISNEGFLKPEQFVLLCKMIGTHGRVSKHFPEGDTKQPRVVDLILDAGCGYALLDLLKKKLTEMHVVASEIFA